MNFDMKTISAFVRVYLPVILGFVLGCLLLPLLGQIFSNGVTIIMVILGGSLLAMLPGIRRYIQSIRIYWGAPNRISQDVSQQERPYPIGEGGIPAQLAELSFKRLGETSTDIPGWRDATTWLFTNPDETIIAEVVVPQRGPLKEMVKFSAWFGSIAVVEVSFPIGEDISTETIRSYRNEKSVSEAYDTQRIEMAAFHHRYGAPHKITSMDELFYWGDIYRKNYSRWILRYGFISSALNLILVGLWTLMLLGFLTYQVLEGRLATLIFVVTLPITAATVFLGMVSLLVDSRFLWMAFRLRRM